MNPSGTRVLELLRKSAVPLGAYDIDAMMGSTRSGRAIASSGVYRELRRLVQQGLVAQIARERTLIACRGNDSLPAFICVCSRCGSFTTIDVHAIKEVLLLAAAHRGFTVGQLTIESLGVCSACEDQARAGHDKSARITHAPATKAGI